MSYIEFLINKFNGKGLVVDTNIWLLLLIGSFNKTEISKCKRTIEYSEEDFETLLKFLKHFKIITTPNILTEVTNLAGTHNNKTDYNLFRRMCELNNIHFEQYIESNTVMNDVFLKFGLTDSIIYHLSKEGFLILTDDFPLYSFLYNQKSWVINFSHLRSEYMIPA